MLLLLSVLLLTLSTMVMGGMPTMTDSQLPLEPYTLSEGMTLSDDGLSQPMIPTRTQQVLEPLPVTREAYEAALNQPAATYLGEGASTTSQGLAIHWEKYDDFFPYIVLGIALPELPGLDRLRQAGAFDRRAYLTVSRVLDRAGKDVYDGESSFEKAPFNGINLQSIEELPGYLEGSREVHVIDDVKEVDIRSVEGAVVLELPVNIQALEFTPTELGNEEKKTLGGAASLTSIDETSYAFDYMGKGKNFIKFIGYDAEGKTVPVIMQTAEVEDSTEVPTRIEVGFEAPVAKIKLFIADEVFIKTIPFTLRTGR